VASRTAYAAGGWGVHEAACDCGTLPFTWGNTEEATRRENAISCGVRQRTMDGLRDAHGGCRTLVRGRGGCILQRAGHA